MIEGESGEQQQENIEDDGLHFTVNGLSFYIRWL